LVAASTAGWASRPRPTPTSPSWPTSSRTAWWVAGSLLVCSTPRVWASVPVCAWGLCAVWTLCVTRQGEIRSPVNPLRKLLLASGGEWFYSVDIDAIKSASSSSGTAVGTLGGGGGATVPAPSVVSACRARPAPRVNKPFQEAFWWLPHVGRVTSLLHVQGAASSVSGAIGSASTPVPPPRVHVTAISAGGAHTLALARVA
jgi:hypothetical protein